jgi:uncharacterized membrane protein (DUF2068 family)
MELRGRPFGLVLIVAYKVLWGLGEVATAALVRSVPARLQAGLTEDPQDRFVGWLLTHTDLRAEHFRAISLVLLAFGLLKIVLAVGIWFRSWMVRDLALAVMALAAVYAALDLVLHMTWLRLVLLAVDLLIICYLWLVLPRHLPPRPQRARAAPT